MRAVLIIIVSATLLLTGCSSRSDDQVERANVDVMYETAQSYLRGGRYADAMQLLREIDSRYPFGPYSQQVQLDLIYAAYKANDQDRALTTIDRFLQLNPNHADNDYVRFMRGLVHLQAERAIIQDLVGVDRSDRNPVYAREALDDFAEVLERHPNSNYAADARARMIGIKSRLASYELAVAEYYLRREAYVAAANRGKYILESFPTVPELERALEIMAESYRELGLERQAADARAMLEANFS